MNPVRTQQTLDTATHPSPDVLDLPIEIRYDEHSTGVTAKFSSYWQPEPAELEALMGGGGVKITVIGVLPPMLVEVVSFERPEPGQSEGSDQMSYSASVSGHGVDAEKAKAAFGVFVRALDEATGEGGTQPAGQISGGESDPETGETRSFSLSANDARLAGDDAEG